MKKTITSRSDLTFKHNVNHGRHSWLRLTPAYSVKLVNQILDDNPEVEHVLDPFCGTGTTALVCGERGINCESLEINPFLVWFARVKTSNFTPHQLQDAKQHLTTIYRDVENGNSSSKLWIPAIKDIDKWWSENTVNTLARLHIAICTISDVTIRDVYLVAFCRILIEVSNAAFNHQSMSFKKPQTSLFDLNEETLLLGNFGRHLEAIIKSCHQSIIGHIDITHADARTVPTPKNGEYDCVITSPPYPNRMSYIRELRPYMYWLGYLSEAREAGELDWQAIGGTWGIATSRISKWQPSSVPIHHPDFADTIENIAKHSQTLANYVHKYFVDIVLHVNSLLPHLRSGAKVFYVIGNSKFYDVLVPAEQIYASILRSAGFAEVKVTPIRKRNSKKELFEFIVSAKKA